MSIEARPSQEHAQTEPWRHPLIAEQYFREHVEYVDRLLRQAPGPWPKGRTEIGGIFGHFTYDDIVPTLRQTRIMDFEMREDGNRRSLWISFDQALAMEAMKYVRKSPERNSPPVRRGKQTIWASLVEQTIKRLGEDPLALLLQTPAVTRIEQLEPKVDLRPHVVIFQSTWH